MPAWQGLFIFTTFVSKDQPFDVQLGEILDFLNSSPAEDDHYPLTEASIFSRKGPLSVESNSSLSCVVRTSLQKRERDTRS